MDLTGYGYGYGSLSLCGQGTSSGHASSGYGYGLSGGYCPLTLSSVPSGYGFNAGVFAKGFSLNLAGYGISDGKVSMIYTINPSNLACYVMSIDTKRTYQYSNYDLSGIGRFNGKVIGARDNKIFDLETNSEKDGELDIHAYLEFATDFSVPNNKALRSLYVEDDEFVVVLTNQDGNELTVYVPFNEFISFPKDTISKHWKIRIHKENGKNLRRITGKISNLAMKGG